MLNYLIENFIGLKTKINQFTYNFTFSDITIKLDGETLYGHRFVLSARSVKWDPQQLGDASELDISGKKNVQI